MADEENVNEDRDSDLLDALVDEPASDAPVDEPTAAPETDEAVETETAEQVTEPVDDTEAETEPTPEPKPHAFDKGLQKLQMELAAERKQREALMAKFDAYFQAKPQEQPKPTPSPIDDILAKDDYDVTPEVKAVANYAKDLERRLSEATKPVQQIAAQVQQLSTQNAVSQFERENPGITYDEAITATNQALDEHFGAGSPVTADVASFVFSQQVKRLASERATAKPAAAPTKQPSTQPDKPTDGTRITRTKPSPTTTKSVRDEPLGEMPIEMIDALVAKK